MTMHVGGMSTCMWMAMHVSGMSTYELPMDNGSYIRVK